MNTPEKLKQITNGPGKWDLIVGFANRKEVEFTIDGIIVRFLTEYMVHEDNSGESFMIAGNIKGESEKIHFYYTSKRRVGVVTKKFYF